ncbi:MAG: HRDC domain-containing protein [Planctomycetia bacterium]|nr:HRDC domain-containing protein [Planctomycetia bacterium]
MQVKVFVIHPGDTESEEELNRFLRSKRVLSMTRNFSDQNGAQWHFCVEYIEGGSPTTPGGRSEKTSRVDYRDKLSVEEFSRFAVLRECRRIIAKDEAIPAFAIFLDEQLAELAKFEEVTFSNLRKVNGIGDKKCEKYGARFIQLWEEKRGEKDAASGEPILENSGDGEPATGVLEGTEAEVREEGGAEIP